VLLASSPLQLWLQLAFISLSTEKCELHLSSTFKLCIYSLPYADALAWPFSYLTLSDV
jgi:hypothetical protein